MPAPFPTVTHHHYCGPLSKAPNAPQCTKAARTFLHYKSASRLRLKQNCGCLNAAAEESTGQRCSISSAAINHRYAHEKSHLFKHDSIRSRGRVSFSSSGKHHRIINEKFKNYFWSFPTRLENLKPNLRDAFSQPEKRKKKKKNATRMQAQQTLPWLRADTEVL